MATTPLIAVQALDVSIGKQRICHSLNFSLEPGQQLAILGQNGVGKSTLLSVLAGLQQGDSGDIQLNGKKLCAHSPRDCARLRGWLGQYRPDSFASSVLETALTGRHPHLRRWDWESKHDAELARAALRAVDLEDLETRNVHTLSGGERQRLAIATLLTQAPQLYLLDEPLTHLDLNHQIAVLDLFARLTYERQAATIMVLHEPGLAWRYCDQALLLFGDGQYTLGPVDIVLRAEQLSRLYGYRLQESNHEGKRWFIPDYPKHCS